MPANLSPLRKLSGFVGAAPVDSDSGMMMESEGGGTLNLEVAAAANTEVVRAKRRAMEELELNDDIEDILITPGEQFHVIHPLPANGALFIYAVVDRKNGNLALSRVNMKATAEKIKL